MRARRGLLGVALGTLLAGLCASAPLFFRAGQARHEGEEGTASDEVGLALHGILQAPDGQCAVLFMDAEGALILPIFIEPAEAAALLAAIEAPNSPQPSADRLALALIDRLGGRLEQMRLDSPEPLKSRGSLLLRGPSGRFSLPAPGALVIALALFTSTPLTIDRAGLEAWGMSQRDFEALIGALRDSDQGAQPSAPRQRSLGL